MELKALLPSTRSRRMERMITGDFIFTQIGDSDNAISAVTEGYRGARVNHMGVLIETPLGKFVLEAFPPEVRLTNLKIHINRSKDPQGTPRYILARLQPEHRHLIKEAISYGLEQRDIPYDRRYLTNNAALYCSELVVNMFRHANGETAFFEEKPMNFRDLRTGEIHEYWKDYYNNFGMEVPEGEPGSNPGDISKDNRLFVYEVVGEITGYRPE